MDSPNDTPAIQRAAMECGADLKENRHGYWSWVAGNFSGHGFEDATEAAIDYLDDWIRRETAKRRKARAERNSVN